MNLVERQQRFLDAVQRHFGTEKSIRPRELFGVSNSAKIVEGGIQLGVVNLESVKDDAEGFIFACVMRFPPEDEVYFAVLVRKDRATFIARLNGMKKAGADAKGGPAAPAASLSLLDDESIETPGASIKYSARNNLVPIYIAADGRLWLRNAKFWDSLAFDLTPFGPSTEPDEIVVSLYPPTASARRSLLAREFIGWLGGLVGTQKIHEIAVWADSATLGPSMHRMPADIAIAELERSVQRLGGHFPDGEVRRLHAALNYHPRKHFVILAGLSGTGKTQLALMYARAVHGVAGSEEDPLLFICPVRPEWTDPAGLTGYYDVLTNRYVVPTFLEAVLVATAHRNSPVFVVLDELNLARVEYYLSDVLSCIETGAALRLHSNGVPLEGTTGTSIRAEIPLPPNLFIVGTINIDETTNPLSDKVLDRASLIDMSRVDVPGFLSFLGDREPALQESISGCSERLAAIHDLMAAAGLGFGYRTIEECIRYYDFDARALQSGADAVLDQLLVQKVLVKLRGSERQRSLLNALDAECEGLPLSQATVRRLKKDLEEFGSFQAVR